MTAPLCLLPYSVSRQKETGRKSPRSRLSPFLQLSEKRPPARIGGLPVRGKRRKGIDALLSFFLCGLSQRDAVPRQRSNCRLGRHPGGQEPFKPPQSRAKRCAVLQDEALPLHLLP